jgi:hypothetical protein
VLDETRRIDGVETRVVCGDDDAIARRPAICRFAVQMARPPRVVIVPGDHGFAPSSKDEAEKLENVDLVVRALVVWAKRQTQR